jgi:hypothetical protein
MTGKPPQLRPNSLMPFGIINSGLEHRMYESVELGRLGRLYARVELGSISGRDSALYIPTSVSGSYVPGFSPQPGLEKNKLYNITFFYISTTMTQVWSQFYDR